MNVVVVSITSGCTYFIDNVNTNQEFEYCKKTVKWLITTITSDTMVRYGQIIYISATYETEYLIGIVWPNTFMHLHRKQQDQRFR
jgi:hypothetical protein